MSFDGLPFFNLPTLGRRWFKGKGLDPSLKAKRGRKFKPVQEPWILYLKSDSF